MRRKRHPIILVSTQTADALQAILRMHLRPWPDGRCELHLTEEVLTALALRTPLDGTIETTIRTIAEAQNANVH